MYRNNFFKSLTVLAVIVLFFSQFNVAEAAKISFGGHLDDNYWEVDPLYCKDGISITAQHTWLSDNPPPALDASPDFWLELGVSSIPVTATVGIDPSARIGAGDGTSLVNGGNPFTVYFFFKTTQTPETPITIEIWRWDHGNQTTIETGEGDDDTLSDDIILDTGVVQDCTINQTAALSSIAANDGWVLESGEKTNKGGTKNSTASTFSIGDNANNKQYLGILHFDTSLPAGAVVTSATLNIKKMGQAGNINLFTKFGGLFIDTKKPGFGTPTLSIGDFQAAGIQNIAKFNNTPVNGWYNATIGSAYINTTGATQFRLRFKLDDNNNFLANYIKFYSGSAIAARRPQLNIQYYVP